MGAVTPVLAINANNASRLLVSYTCEASTSEGDWVYLDSTIDNRVITATGNTQTSPVIGVIFDKQTDNNCRVLVLGASTSQSGLVKGKKVFLDTDGTATTTKPSTGYAQVLGVASSATEMLVNTQINRILQYGP